LTRRLALFAAVASLAAAAPARADLAAEVDPLAGTMPPGFVFPGAAVPFGMVQNSPDTTGEFAYGGYLYSDAVIRGFSLVHLSGPGVRKAGDLPFMPTLGPATDDPSLYASPFTHARERAEPGYYRVALDASQTDVELTAGTRVAMQRYTFAPSPDAKVIMDTARSVEGTAPASWRVTGPDEVTGRRRGRYPVFFVARFDRPFETHGAFAGDDGGWVGFDTTGDRVVTVRVGISFVDEAGARRNLDAEGGQSFEQMRAAARAAWNRELSTVELGGGTAVDRRSFYTALYRAQLHPNVFNDVDGRYRGFDDAVHVAEGRTQYANFSSWDTYKAQNQWLALTRPARYREMLASLLADAQQGGRLPRWGEQSIDAAHMSGDPAVPMIADGVCRGLLDRRTATALYEQAVALRGHRPAELDALGFLPMRPGTTLEYGIADFALALMADALGRHAEAQRWLAASLNYRNVLDPSTRWVRPRNADGSWHEPFDPALDETGFQEGNAWQYSWLAPHDARGLVDRMGGDAAVRERMETFFALPPEVQNRVTLFGIAYRFPQYAPGNEHDLQAPWMPVFAGAPWKAAEVHRAVQPLFRPLPDGLPGNDDLGSLSAWHLWSMLGLGPVTPGAPFHVIGSPAFERAVVRLPSGRALTIRAPGASALAKYVRGARVDGRALGRAWVDEARLRRGATLDLEMGVTPDRAWGSAPEARPPSASDGPLSRFGCRSAGTGGA
jgi:predicted alpha-1,2-mannosidase